MRISESQGVKCRQVPSGPCSFVHLLLSLCVCCVCHFLNWHKPRLGPHDPKHERNYTDERRKTADEVCSQKCRLSVRTAAGGRKLQPAPQFRWEGAVPSLAGMLCGDWLTDRDRESVEPSSEVSSCSPSAGGGC